MNAAELKAGDYIATWHQTFGGAHAQSTIVYALVISNGPKMVTIMGEDEDRPVRKSHRKMAGWRVLEPTSWHPEISAPAERERVSASVKTENRNR